MGIKEPGMFEGDIYGDGSALVAFTREGYTLFRLRFYGESLAVDALIQANDDMYSELNKAKNKMSNMQATINEYAESVCVRSEKVAELAAQVAQLQSENSTLTASCVSQYKAGHDAACEQMAKVLLDMIGQIESIRLA